MTYDRYYIEIWNIEFSPTEYLRFCGFHFSREMVKKTLKTTQEWAFNLGPHCGSSRLREYGSHNAHDPKISKENGDSFCVYPKAILTLWIIFHYLFFEKMII